MFRKLKVLIFFLPSVGFAEAKWIETERDEGCIYYKGESSDGDLLIRAVCEWDIPAKNVHQNIGDFENHVNIFSQLSKSELVSKDTEKTNILQVHDFPGLSDRTAIIEYKIQNLPDGKRYSFSKSTDQEGISSSYVELTQNSGSWEITETEDGSKIIFENFYSAGGYIPSTLTGWFQVSGAQKLMNELKSYVKKSMQ